MKVNIVYIPTMWVHLGLMITLMRNWQSLSLSFRVFGLLSSSLYSRFSRYVLWPSSCVCWSQEPSRNFELRPLLNPQGSFVLIPLTITRYISTKYSCIVTHLQSGLNLQMTVSLEAKGTNAYNHYTMHPARQFRVNFWTYKLDALTSLWINTIMYDFFYLTLYSNFFFKSLSYISKIQTTNSYQAPQTLCLNYPNLDKHILYHWYWALYINITIYIYIYVYIYIIYIYYIKHIDISSYL